MDSKEINDDNKEHEEILRFMQDLEFVQCLANPYYLKYLSNMGYFDDENFVNYLQKSLFAANVIADFSAEGKEPVLNQFKRSILTPKMFCGDCGSKLYYPAGKNVRDGSEYFRCSQYKRTALYARQTIMFGIVSCVI